ncbi:hypothetical protein CHAB381_1128 [Campylobacter hominis ATCC BAA-381]|uniref:Uncharacterized protein n=1 Tax=Campylobacter hominis (strain ATCC BAA-381 / DSM 21671 / CCUG 45161 / LMG 19568 / NCTC 13146 / CH001A) TaxID=360107 RepID=A7I2E3_CAMHC|nr:hypothetical protein CHAB381_1128 [Campylobacter hominis ATCC BAA-381]
MKQQCDKGNQAKCFYLLICFKDVFESKRISLKAFKIFDVEFDNNASEELL